ncbi:DUF6503 family protein [Pelobium manganitolerans]|uniref:DUF6503 family protein n=1 Tax=Pelobium manganitolerans TaxID=1842495 RepID=UPI003FA3B5AA
MRRSFIYGFFAVFACTLLGCFGENANKIIDKSIAFYGMDKIEGKTIEFDFREKHFKVKKHKGNFYYESSYRDDSLGLVKDKLSNHGFAREVNGRLMPLSGKDSVKFAESLNSVVYFAFLPLKLKDEAVQAKFLRTVQIKGSDYLQVEVTFAKENGGDHYDDTFYFWFDARDKSMDYFAYSKGGDRFRAGNGLIRDKGLYLQNYVNLENKNPEKTALKDYYKLFEQDKLSTLSYIELRNLKVSD